MNDIQRILVVEDEATTRDAVAEILTDEGFSVQVAEDGAHAIELLTSFIPHLVLTDLKMVPVDGVGLLDHLKESNPGLPVLVITARATADAERVAREHGAVDFLNKPLDVNDMLARIRRHLTPAA